MRYLLPLLLLIVASCDRAPSHPAPTEPPEYARARAAVLSVLKDPESARFSDIHAGRPGFLCGTVNARNGFGGYTGARAFFWSSDGVRVYEDPPDWSDKGIEAEIFGERGCSIGADHAKALEARRLLGISEKS